MKKILFCMALAITAPAFAQFNTLVHFEQGGSTLAVEDGGLLWMKAGSTLTVNAAADINISATPTFTTLNISGAATVGGALGVTGAATAATLNTGQGAYELYKMDQNVDVAASPTFVGLTLSGVVSGATSNTATKFIASGEGSIQLYSRSKAQLLLLTPSAIGQTYYCNDCTTVAICVSTATAVHSIVKSTDRAAACD